MKIAVCILSASLVAVVSADLSSFRVPRAGNTEDSGPVNYEFAYEVKDAPSNNDFGHMESRNGEVAKGSYHVLLPDGRTQRVDYTADENGYVPKINYDGSPSGASYRF
ncbi:pro-resilin-like isoform X3 [Nilaparvata lugens]|uniref:Cuticular protein n=1 Tax=Nilaparvata lugens TaxID=108931 RepID=A0A2S1ZSE8_NILLU|nr:pro-resilin-like isoform X3 [Nilaparvata lugens]AWK28384.1 cuticular protein [Nilaparvata lugens]